MKRIRSESHGLTSDDLSTAKRIVRRKVSNVGQRSLSPSANVHSHAREVRSTASVLKYHDKYSGSSGKYSSGGGKYSKYNEEESERYDRYEPRTAQHTREREEENVRSFGTTRRVSSHAHVRGGGSNHSHSFSQLDRFDFSLRIGSLDVDMLDSELKSSLFERFKRFGYINVKVLGHSSERHAFINFTQQECARRARNEMSDFVLQGVELKTEWSKSTLMKYPDLAHSGMGNRSRGGMTRRPSHNRHLSSEDHYNSSYSTSSGRESLPSREKSYSTQKLLSRGSGGGSSRDLSYKSSGNAPSLSTSSRTHRSTGTAPSSSSSSSSRQQSQQHEPRTVVPITDPSATRTLFVGNLEPDITERELRDLFGPYGRIESVDIKTQRMTGSTYAFVKFLTINDAINAKNDMHGRKYGEYRLKIGFGRGSPTGKVWIGNLTCYADLSEVRQELDRFGLIRRLDYQDGDNHAYIQFDCLDAAQAAVASLAGYRIRNSGRTLKIDICKPMHLRDDFHEESTSDYHHSKNTDESFTSGYKRRVRDQDSYYETGESTQRSGNKGNLNSSKGMNKERIVSALGGGRDQRGRDIERIRTYRKRPHSPANVGGSGSNRHRGDGVNGELEYHSKRTKMLQDGRRERERERERDAKRNFQERDSKTGGGDPHFDKDSGKRRESSEQSGKLSSKKEGETGEEGDRKTDKKEQLPKERPPLEPTLSDIAASKDTALKLDGSIAPLSLVSTDTTESSLESLSDLAKLFPVAWRGNLVLKNTGFPTRMHLIGGDPTVAENLLRNKEGKEYLNSLRITQRLRLEQPRLEEVNKRMVSAGSGGHCVLLALPGPTPTSLSPSDSVNDSAMQLRPLKSLVSYLKQKEAAGIVALSSPDGGSETASASVDRDVMGVLHAFPPCEFSQSHLCKIAPRLGTEPSKEDHIVVLLVKGNV